MHKKIKKYFYGGINGAPPGISNGSALPGYNPIIGGATPGYAPTSSTGINAGVGIVLQGLGSLLGGSFNGELGNAIGLIGGNLSSNILSAGNLSDGLKNFADLDLFGKSNMSTFGTRNFKGFGNMGNLAMGIGSGILDRSTAHQRMSGKYGSLASGVDMIGGTLGQFGNYGGYGALGQLGMSAVNKITGGTDGMTIADSLLGSSSLAGGLTTINPLLGAGYIALSGLNSATGKTTTKNANNDFQSKEELATLWSSYGKSYKDHQNALQYGGKKYGGISRLTGSFGRADRRVRNDNTRTNTLMDIYDRADLGRIRGEQMADINSLDYRLNTFGGYNQYGTRIGRKGMKLPTKQDVDRVKNILSCKKGGQMNVIPEGALHARKNHMEGAGKDFTHKGIPVMDKDGEQQAEIERNEIIFSLEVTLKLERLKNDGSDEAAIKAGKLLVDEIFHNTDDRTGLIAEVIGQNTTVFKEGGVLLAEEPEIESEIDVEEPVGIEEVEYYQEGGVLEEGDNAIIAEEPEVYEIEEFGNGNKVYLHFIYKPKPKPKYEDWIKDVNPEYLNDNYDIKMAYEVLPFELLERWKFGVNSNDPKYYMDYQDNNGIYTYHLPSIAELDNGDFIFLKKGTESVNPELHFETDMYHNGENGFKNTHDLKFEGDRYYYRKKKSSKKEDGGVIEQLNNLSPDKLLELLNILKYLNQ